MNKNISAFIFAREGSKGLPGKNWKNFCGVPLIQHTIRQCLESEYIGRVIVSTDSPEIARIAENAGGLVPFLRPKRLALDNSPEFEAWKHAIIAFGVNQLKAESNIFLSVPCTAPCRSVQHIDGAVRLFLANRGEIDGVITTTEANRNPWFNQVIDDQMGFCRLAIDDGKRFSRRQDAPVVQDMATVCFVFDPEFVLNNVHIFAGRLMAYQVDKISAIDIDTEDDFLLAEYFYQRRTRGD